MGGGAWPFLVGGVICLVNSVNERDLNQLNSVRLNAMFKMKMNAHCMLGGCTLLDGQFCKPYPVAHVKFRRVQVPGLLNQGLSMSTFVRTREMVWTCVFVICSFIALVRLLVRTKWT